MGIMVLENKVFMGLDRGYKSGMHHFLFCLLFLFSLLILFFLHFSLIKQW